MAKITIKNNIIKKYTHKKRINNKSTTKKLTIEMMLITALFNRGEDLLDIKTFIDFIDDCRYLSFDGTFENKFKVIIDHIDDMIKIINEH